MHHKRFWTAPGKFVLTNHVAVYIFYDLFKLCQRHKIGQ